MLDQAAHHTLGSSHWLPQTWHARRPQSQDTALGACPVAAENRGVFWASCPGGARLGSLSPRACDEVKGWEHLNSPMWVPSSLPILWATLKVSGECPFSSLMKCPDLELAWATIASTLTYMALPWLPAGGPGRGKGRNRCVLPFQASMSALALQVLQARLTVSVVHKALSGNSSDEGCHGLLSFHSQEMASPPDLQRGVVDHAPIHCSVSLCCPRCCMTPFSCFSIQFPWQILLEMCFLCIFCIFSLFIFRGNHITEADPIHHVGSSSPWQSQDLEDSL